MLLSLLSQFAIQRSFLLPANPSLLATSLLTPWSSSSSSVAYRTKFLPRPQKALQSGLAQPVCSREHMSRPPQETHTNAPHWRSWTDALRCTDPALRRSGPACFATKTRSPQIGRGFSSASRMPFGTGSWGSTTTQRWSSGWCSDHRKGTWSSSWPWLLLAPAQLHRMLSPLLQLCRRFLTRL